MSYYENVSRERKRKKREEEDDGKRRGKVRWAGEAPLTDGGGETGPLAQISR